MAVQPIKKETVPVKTYVLLDALDIDGSFYQQLGNGQRSQLRKIPLHRPYLEVPLQTKDGEAKVLRFKEHSNFIYKNDQWEKEKIDANAKFTQKEYDLPKFKNGVLTTNKKNLQDFLESHPEYLGFEGFCDYVAKPCYKLLDKSAEAKLKSLDIKKRIEAGKRIYDMSLQEIQDLMIRINGRHFAPPADIEDCQIQMMTFIEDTNDEGLKEIMNGEATIDQKVLILISRLINAGSLQFDDNGDIKRKIKTGDFTTVRNISSEYDLDQRISYFSDFLNTEDGKLLKTELESDLQEIDNKNSKKTKT